MTFAKLVRKLLSSQYAKRSCPYISVPSQEFANFVDDLGMNLPFSATHDLYNKLCDPCEGMLLLSNFYKNLEGETCTLTELHRRLEEAGPTLA